MMLLWAIVILVGIAKPELIPFLLAFTSVA